MRIFYFTNTRLPTEKAHGVATVKLCSAFAALGHEVMIIHPWRRNPLRGDVYAYYGVERNFTIITLPSIDFLWLGFGERFLFLVQLFSFSKIAALWLFFRYRLTGRLGDTVIFSHDHIPLFFVSFFAPQIFYDIHHYPEHTFLYERVLRRAIGVGVQTKWKADAIRRDFGIPPEKIVYWPNGTDIERFDIRFTVNEARVKLGLPQEKKIVLYAGSLQRWKGVDTLVQAAELLPPDIFVYIVGGNTGKTNFQFPRPTSPGPSPGGRAISNFQNRVVFVGQRPWSEIPLWLKAADVLVLPNSGRMKVSQYYTSPMKLFEYMASGRPIVASDVPAIHEIVDETMVFFAQPDNPRSFADAIRQALANPEEARRRAERALQEVVIYSWAARAEKILGLMQRSG